MTSLPEQLSAARKTQLEAQLELLRSFSTQAISSAEQVIHLNLNVTRNSVEQSSAAVKQLLAVRDPRDLLAFGTASQQQFQQLMDYGRNLFSIAAGARLDLQASMPKLAVPPAATPEAFVPDVAAAPVAPAQFAPAPEAMAAAEPAPAPVAAAAPQAEPAPQPASFATQPHTDDQAEAAIDALAEAARSAQPGKVVEVEEPQAAPVGPKETAIASAAGQMAAAAGNHEHPAASLPGSGKIQIPKITPVEASPPPAPVSGTPVFETKPQPRATKGSRKK